MIMESETGLGQDGGGTSPKYATPLKRRRREDPGSAAVAAATTSSSAVESSGLGSVTEGVEEEMSGEVLGSASAKRRHSLDAGNGEGTTGVPEGRVDPFHSFQSSVAPCAWPPVSVRDPREKGGGVGGRVGVGVGTGRVGSTRTHRAPVASSEAAEDAGIHGMGGGADNGLSGNRAAFESSSAALGVAGLGDAGFGLSLNQLDLPRTKPRPFSFGGRSGGEAHGAGGTESEDAVPSTSIDKTGRPQRRNSNGNCSNTDTGGEENKTCSSSSSSSSSSSRSSMSMSMGMNLSEDTDSRCMPALPRDRRRPGGSSQSGGGAARRMNHFLNSSVDPMEEVVAEERRASRHLCGRVERRGVRPRRRRAARKGCRQQHNHSNTQYEC